MNNKTIETIAKKIISNNFGNNLNYVSKVLTDNISKEIDKEDKQFSSFFKKISPKGIEKYSNLSLNFHNKDSNKDENVEIQFLDKKTSKHRKDLRKQIIQKMAAASAQSFYNEIEVRATTGSKEQGFNSLFAFRDPNNSKKDGISVLKSLKTESDSKKKEETLNKYIDSINELIESKYNSNNDDDLVKRYLEIKPLVEAFNFDANKFSDFYHELTKQQLSKDTLRKIETCCEKSKNLIKEFNSDVARIADPTYPYFDKDNAIKVYKCLQNVANKQNEAKNKAVNPNKNIKPKKASVDENINVIVEEKSNENIDENKDKDIILDAQNDKKINDDNINPDVGNKNDEENLDLNNEINELEKEAQIENPLDKEKFILGNYEEVVKIDPKQKELEIQELFEKTKALRDTLRKIPGSEPFNISDDKILKNIKKKYELYKYSKVFVDAEFKNPERLKYIKSKIGDYDIFLRNFEPYLFINQNEKQVLNEINSETKRKHLTFNQINNFFNKDYVDIINKVSKPDKDFYKYVDKNILLFQAGFTLDAIVSKACSNSKDYRDKQISSYFSQNKEGLLNPLSIGANIIKSNATEFCFLHDDIIMDKKKEERDKISGPFITGMTNSQELYSEKNRPLVPSILAYFTASDNEGVKKIRDVLKKKKVKSPIELVSKDENLSVCKAILQNKEVVKDDSDKKRIQKALKKYDLDYYNERLNDPENSNRLTNPEKLDREKLLSEKNFKNEMNFGKISEKVNLFLINFNPQPNKNKDSQLLKNDLENLLNANTQKEFDTHLLNAINHAVEALSDKKSFNENERELLSSLNSSLQTYYAEKEYVGDVKLNPEKEEDIIKEAEDEKDKIYKDNEKSVDEMIEDLQKEEENKDNNKSNNAQENNDLNEANNENKNQNQDNKKNEDANKDNVNIIDVEKVNVNDEDKDKIQNNPEEHNEQNKKDGAANENIILNEVPENNKEQIKDKNDEKIENPAVVDREKEIDEITQKIINVQNIMLENYENVPTTFKVFRNRDKIRELVKKKYDLYKFCKNYNDSRSKTIGEKSAKFQEKVPGYKSLFRGAEFLGFDEDQFDYLGKELNTDNKQNHFCKKVVNDIVKSDFVKHIDRLSNNKIDFIKYYNDNKFILEAGHDAASLVSFHLSDKDPDQAMLKKHINDNINIYESTFVNEMNSVPFNGTLVTFLFEENYPDYLQDDVFKLMNIVCSNDAKNKLGNDTYLNLTDGFYKLGTLSIDKNLNKVRDTLVANGVTSPIELEPVNKNESLYEAICNGHKVKKVSKETKEIYERALHSTDLAYLHEKINDPEHSNQVTEEEKAEYSKLNKAAFSNWNKLINKHKKESKNPNFKRIKGEINKLIENVDNNDEKYRLLQNIKTIAQENYDENLSQDNFENKVFRYLINATNDYMSKCPNYKGNVNEANVVNEQQNNEPANQNENVAQQANNVVNQPDNNVGIEQDKNKVHIENQINEPLKENNNENDQHINVNIEQNVEKDNGDKNVKPLYDEINDDMFLKYELGVDKDDKDPFTFDNYVYFDENKVLDKDDAEKLCISNKEIGVYNKTTNKKFILSKNNNPKYFPHSFNTIFADAISNKIGIKELIDPIYSICKDVNFENAKENVKKLEETIKNARNNQTLMDIEGNKGFIDYLEKEIKYYQSGVDLLNKYSKGLDAVQKEINNKNQQLDNADVFNNSELDNEEIASKDENLRHDIPKGNAANNIKENNVNQEDADNKKNKEPLNDFGLDMSNKRKPIDLNKEAIKQTSKKEEQKHKEDKIYEALIKENIQSAENFLENKVNIQNEFFKKENFTQLNEESLKKVFNNSNVFYNSKGYLSPEKAKQALNNNQMIGVLDKNDNNVFYRINGNNLQVHNTQHEEKYEQMKEILKEGTNKVNNQSVEYKKIKENIENLSKDNANVDLALSELRTNMNRYKENNKNIDNEASKMSELNPECVKKLEDTLGEVEKDRRVEKHFDIPAQEAGLVKNNPKLANYIEEKLDEAFQPEDTELYDNQKFDSKEYIERKNTNLHAYIENLAKLSAKHPEAQDMINSLVERGYNEFPDNQKTEATDKFADAIKNGKAKDISDDDYKALDADKKANEAENENNPIKKILYILAALLIISTLASGGGILGLGAGGLSGLLVGGGCIVLSGYGGKLIDKIGGLIGGDKEAEPVVNAVRKGKNEEIEKIRNEKLVNYLKEHKDDLEEWRRNRQEAAKRRRMNLSEEFAVNNNVFSNKKSGFHQEGIVKDEKYKNNAELNK